jgi:glycosyltransferase involved in cell wall biosynthesis
MRILIVTNNYTPYSGGVVSSLNAFIPALQQAGHDVIVVAPQFLASHSDDPMWVRRVPSLIRFTWHNNRMALPWRSKKYLSNVMQEFKPDVVHVQHPFLLGAAALKIAHIRGVPVVFTYHTMYEAYAHYVPLPQWLVRKCILSLVKRFCNAVDTVIVPGNAVKDLVRERGVTTSIVVIPSPLQEIFLQSRERKQGKFLSHEYARETTCEHNKQRDSLSLGDCEKSQQSDNRLILLSVGRFVPEKNMAAVLDLYVQLPRDRFRLVLVGYGLLYEALQHYAYTTLGLSRNDVQFVHRPPQSVIAQWYADADLFIFTSQTDTQGLVLVEAMAGWLPVLALPGAGQQEVVHDGVNGYICNSITEMREKIMQLADAPAQRELLRTGARETAQKYRPEVLAQQVIRVYERLVK